MTDFLMAIGMALMFLMGWQLRTWKDMPWGVDFVQVKFPLDWESWPKWATRARVELVILGEDESSAPHVVGHTHEIHRPGVALATFKRAEDEK